MFANTVQPGVVSLFSSTGSKPLQLFEVGMDADPEMRADSVVCFVRDDEPVDALGGEVRRAEAGAAGDERRGEGGEVKLVEPAPLYDGEGDGSDEGENRRGSGAEDHEGPDDARSVSTRRKRKRKRKMGGEVGQTVLHLQSPTIRSTFIRCPPGGGELGLGMGWMHMQVRRMGSGDGSGRDAWAVDVGVADRAGKRGVIRLSTFQKEASLKPNHDPPLLHIPVRFSSSSQHHPPSTAVTALTSWATIDLDLHATMRYFPLLSQNMRRDRDSSANPLQQPSSQLEPHTRQLPVPKDGFAFVTFVKVYANCRLRRIWFSEDRQSANLPWEFQLYAAD